MIELLTNEDVIQNIEDGGAKPVSADAVLEALQGVEGGGVGVSPEAGSQINIGGHTYIIGENAEKFNNTDDNIVIGNNAHASGDKTTALGDNSYTEGGSNNKALEVVDGNASDDTIISAWGGNKFSMAKGNNSHVEGSNNLALGEFTHVDGVDNIASGYGAKAGGCYTVASGDYSETSGFHTTASGNQASANGNYTTASGNNSSTNGDGTVASGVNSHADGAGTIAAGADQFVVGKFNKVDGNNEYAFIVGNGGNTNTRENAFAVDWDGNVVSSSGKALSKNDYTDGDKAKVEQASSKTQDLQNQINNIVSPVTQDAEVQNARVGADGHPYSTLKERLDTEQTSVKEDLSQFTETINGSTGLKGIETAGIIGTAQRWTSYSNSGHCVLPIKNGDVISLKANSNVNLNYAILTSSENADNQLVNFSTDTNWNNRKTLTKGTTTEFTAPSDSKFLYLQTYYSTSNTIPTSVKINGVEMTYNVRKKVDSISDIVSNIDNKILFESHDLLPSGTDLNTVTDNGFYNLSSSGTYDNAPTATGYRSVIVYTQPNSSVKRQIFYDFTTGAVYMRSFVNAAWQSWKSLSVNVDDRVKEIETKQIFYTHETIPTGTDLDTITEIGFYNLSSSGTYINSPVATKGYNSLAVYTQPNSSVKKQIFYDISNGTTYFRYFASGKWNDWTDNTDVIGFKLTLGRNPYRKAIDHGGFWNTTYPENSPMAFIRSAKQGIVYHNIDICFSSDGVPFCWHDNTTTDKAGNTFKMNETTAENIKTHVFGNDDYEFNLMTLAEADHFIKKLSGVLEMVDVTAGDKPELALQNAQNLPDYYRQHNIKPSFTNWDLNTNRNAFIQNGAEFGVYLVVDATNIGDALTYIRNHSNTKFCVNLGYNSVKDIIDNYLPQFVAMGVTIYTGVFNASSFNQVPQWADGVLSENGNINYYDWTHTV